MSPGDIAARSGVSVGQVKEVAAGRCERIYEITEESILGVVVPDGDWIPVADGFADATGSRRRLQALTVQGFPLSFLTVETGLAKSTVSLVRSGRKTQIMSSVLRTIRAAHEKFWDEDPLELGVSPEAVAKAKGWSKKYGWLPTEAWDDIDDPDCKPRTKPTPKYVRVAEDYREMTERFGLNRRQAAERLEMSVDALNAALGYYEKRMASAS